MASVWPPISEVFSGASEKALCQTQRTFFLLPAKMSLFSGSFSTAPGSSDRRQSEPTSLCETGLKIRWTYHPCGFESHHRHHRRTLIWIQLGPFFFAPLPYEKSPYPMWFFDSSHTNCRSGRLFIHPILDDFQPITAKSPSRPTLKSCASELKY